MLGTENHIYQRPQTTGGIYDSSVRKADSLRAHLGRLPEAERTEALEKIKALNPAFMASGH